jgi:hypothetical protein
MNVPVGRVEDDVAAGVRRVYVGRGRGSVLGNPLPVIGKSAWTAQAEHWTRVMLDDQDADVRVAAAAALARRGYPQAASLYRHVLRAQGRTSMPQRAVVLTLAMAAAAGETLRLECWCSPRPCHAAVIQAAVLGYAARFLTPGG